MNTKVIFLIVAFALSLVFGKAQAQTDGTIDTSFAIGTGFNHTVRAIAIQPDGKILAGGGFIAYNGTARNGIARLNTDGTLDTSFTIGTGFNDAVTVIAVQPDGKILAGGYFTEYNDTERNRIIRLNTDGTVDTSFIFGTGFNATVTAIAVQPDGKILVGGLFWSYNGETQSRITRLNTDGTIDTDFIIGTGFNLDVHSIALQSDGKILVGGDFYSYKGQAQNRIARLNTDGTIDTSFVIGTGFNNTFGSVMEITVQPDGKILIGGGFTAYNGTAQNKIARLNTDGTLDTSFTIGTGFNNPDYGRVITISVQPDGKILAGGWFTSYNGTTQNKITRLNADGTLDTSFSIGTGFNTDITSNGAYTIALQPDGKILAGGYFTTYNGTAQNNIVRLYSYIQCPTGDLVFNSQAEIDAFAINYPNCTLITGNLIISGLDIEDLSSLSNLTEINGNIIITGCPLLTNLDGLSNVTSIGGISVGGKLMNSESQMNNGGILQIEDNSLLNDISGLANIDPSTITELIIKDNPNLLVCSLSNFCTYLSNEDNPNTILNNAGNCMNEQTVLNMCSTYEISISANPTTAGEVNGGGTYNYGDTATLTATANTGYTFVNWTEDDTEVSTDSEYSFVVDSDRDLVANFTETSSVSGWKLEKIAIYPNPVKDILYFEQEVQKATITDLTGKVLFVQSNSSQIDMSAFQSGVYLIVVEQENGVRETKKVIKS